MECRFIRTVYLAALIAGASENRYRLGILARYVGPMPLR